MPKSNIHAVIVGISQYRFSTGAHALPAVEFAHEDANAFHQLLVDQFSVSEANIHLWLDSEATKPPFENELPYILRNLEENSEFIFYYAGHGFRSGEDNLLTVWDTHPSNLEQTSVSLKNTLLEPLNKSACRRSLLFVDACAKDIPKIGRDVITSLDPEDFKKFIRAKGAHAQFMACSMGEKSYSSAPLRHGIWTWHLLQALSGIAPEAFARDYVVTDVSLRDYLRMAVPEYITKKTSLKGTQTPWAHLKGSTFEIISFPPPEVDTPAVIASIEIHFDDAFFRRVQEFPVKSLGGFKKGHTAPKWHTSAARSFVASAAAPDIEDETTEIYDNLKGLGFRRREITKEVGDDGANIETEQFRFVLEYRQSDEDPSQVVVERTLTLRCKPEDLPEGFEGVFPTGMKEVVIPFTGKADFDSLVEAFEDLQENHGGSLSENDKDATITYDMPKGASVKIFCNEKEIVFFPSNTTSISKMIEGSKDAFVSLREPRQHLLEDK